MKLTTALAAALLCLAPAAGFAQPPAEPEPVQEAAEVETGPVLLNPGALIAAHDSLYPADRRRGRRRAAVEMSLVVGRDGVPGSVAIVRSGDRAYDEASLAVARRMRFSPATLGGEPAAVRVRFTMDWGQYWSPSSRPDTVVAELHGSRRRSVEGAPIYNLWEVSWFGELPRLLNPETLREHLLPWAEAIQQHGGSDDGVLVELVLDRKGEIVEARIPEITDPRVAQAMLAAVRLLRFEPGTMFDSPVDAELLLPVQVR